jgi:hypothetical protein
MKICSLLLGCLILSAVISCTKDKMNKVPSANAGPSQTIQRPRDSVTLTGSGSDIDGIIVGYLWSELAGPSIAAIHTPAAATTKVSGLIAGTYRFQLMVIDDDGATGLDTLSVVVSTAEIKELSLQPGPNDGQDAVVFNRDGDATAPNGNYADRDFLAYSRWTYSAEGFGEGGSQTYIKFTGLSAIPASAEIISARLYLYGIPVNSTNFHPGNSHYPGSPYGSGPENPGWVRRVTGNWDESTITWNNKPGNSNTNQVAIPGTTAQWNYNLPEINVTELVKTIVSSGSNFGFNLSLQTESTYRSVLLSSSEVSDAARRPKLVVVYK